jgi:hypothetical protein
MSNDEWDALEHYLRAGAELTPDTHSEEARRQLAAVIRMAAIEETPA